MHTKPKFPKVAASDLLANAEVGPYHQDARGRGDRVPRGVHGAAAADAAPSHSTRPAHAANIEHNKYISLQI